MTVDYTGIGDELREATATYARGGDQGEVAPDLPEAARPVFFESLSEVRRLLPEDVDYGDWRRLGRIAREETLRKYHNRLIEAADVIQAMMEIKTGMETEIGEPPNSVSKKKSSPSMTRWRTSSKASTTTSSSRR